MALSAFAFPAFRVFAAAQFVSFTVLTVQIIVRSWMVQELTGSPFLVALVPSLHLLPTLALGFFGGELADRFDRRKIVFWCEAALIASYVSLALLVVTGVAEAWHVLATTAVIGVAYALASPARQALLTDVVPPQIQRRAIGSYMLVIHLTLLAAPALGGTLLTMHGIGAALMFSALLAVPFAFLNLRFTPLAAPIRAGAQGKLIKNLVAGVGYIRSDPSMRSMFLGLLVMVLFVNTWGAMFPTIAQDVLGQGAAGLSGLTMALGAGAIIGAILAVFLEGRMPDAWQQFGAALLFAGLVALLAVSTSFPVSLAITVAASAAGAPFFINNMIATQVGAADGFRSRVVSVRYVVLAIQPVGMMAVGAAAEMVGPQLALGGSAVIGAVLVGLIAVAGGVPMRAGRPVEAQPAPVEAEAVPAILVPQGGSD
ncbi:MAG: MFS transporter [Dehalococcoidia bacterium]